MKTIFEQIMKIAEDNKAIDKEGTLTSTKIQSFYQNNL